MRNFSGFLSEQTLALKKSKSLRPELFNLKTNKLNPEVRQQVLKVADFWREKVNIPKSAVKRVDLVGSSVGYLYHQKSDLDIHLIVSMDKISECEELLRDYLRAEKKLFQLEYDVKINGIEAELYAEDEEDPRPSLQARYDATNDKWVTEPDRDRVPEINDRDIQTKAEIYIDRVEDVVDDGITNIDVLNRLKERILNLRKLSLNKNGEFAQDNLVYKIVRGSGALDRLDRYMRGVESEDLSLNQ